MKAVMRAPRISEYFHITSFCSRWHPGAGWSQRATWAILMCGMGVSVIASAADPVLWVCIVSTAVLIIVAAAGLLLAVGHAPACVRRVTGWGEL